MSSVKQQEESTNDDAPLASERRLMHSMTRLLIVTTVPETLATILKLQPRYLANFFDVSLATSPGDWLEKVAQNERLAISVVPMSRGISVLHDLVSVVRMILVLRTVRPELVQSYTPKAGLVCMLAAWLCRIPVRVHTFTGLIFPTAKGLRQKLLIWVDRLICACATHIVPEGQGVKEDLERFNITRKPMKIIGYGNIAGVDSDYFSQLAPGVKEASEELKKKLGIGPHDFVFCFVGRHNKEKGLKELQIAFSKLTFAAHLLLIGDMDVTAPVDAITMDAFVAHPRAHQLGFLSDVRAALSASDVLVLPSYREGFPNAVLQAGAMELPVIASDINGCNEVIEPNFNGWLVPPRDAKALGIAMYQAMHTSPSVRSKMAQQARTRIQQRFERKRHWEHMVAFYQGLLDDRQKG